MTFSFSASFGVLLSFNFGHFTGNFVLNLRLVLLTIPFIFYKAKLLILERELKSVEHCTDKKAANHHGLPGYFIFTSRNGLLVRTTNGFYHCT